MDAAGKEGGRACPPAMLASGGVEDLQSDGQTPPVFKSHFLPCSWDARGFPTAAPTPQRKHLFSPGLDHSRASSLPSVDHPESVCLLWGNPESISLVWGTHSPSFLSVDHPESVSVLWDHPESASALWGAHTARPHQRSVVSLLLDSRIPSSSAPTRSGVAGESVPTASRASRQVPPTGRPPRPTRSCRP